MNNLTPQVRVNKNGVPVKKYVRTDTKSGSSTSKLPVPSAGAEAPRAIPPLLTLEFRRKEVQAGITLDDLDPDAVAEIERMLGDHSLRRTVSYTIQSAVRHALDTLEGDRSVRFLHSVAVFGTLESDSNYSLTTFINGLSQYPESVLDPDTDYYLDAPDELVKGAQALLDFTVKAGNATGDILVYDSFMDTLDEGSGVTEVYTKLRDPELASYVLKHPDRSDDIIDMIKKSGPLPLGTIEARFDLGVPSLSEGML